MRLRILILIGLLVATSVYAVPWHLSLDDLWFTLGINSPTECKSACDGLCTTPEMKLSVDDFFFTLGVDNAHACKGACNRECVRSLS